MDFATCLRGLRVVIFVNGEVEILTLTVSPMRLLFPSRLTGAVRTDSALGARKYRIPNVMILSSFRGGRDSLPTRVLWLALAGEKRVSKGSFFCCIEALRYFGRLHTGCCKVHGALLMRIPWLRTSRSQHFVPIYLNVCNLLLMVISYSYMYSYLHLLPFHLLPFRNL